MFRPLTLLSALLIGCGSTEPASAPAEPAPAPAAAAPAPAKAPHAKPDKGEAVYACPMHPQETSNEPGECSQCGMALEKQEAHDHGSHDHGDEPKSDDGHDGHGH